MAATLNDPKRPAIAPLHACFHQSTPEKTVPVAPDEEQRRGYSSDDSTRFRSAQGAIVRKHARQRSGPRPGRDVAFEHLR